MPMFDQQCPTKENFCDHVQWPWDLAAFDMNALQTTFKELQSVC